ncbi:hypothetical protein M2108_000555 [Paenibacillus sp. PastM-3]|nr:hypothetical protein [Paenibacillus sp. PastM-2]MDH6477864.1 hypothetical protein [Paenibacillus sp. PastH-2]MDH6505603.1 hypothetical protein [Paenibacillus sp. PastM-3]
MPQEVKDYQLNAFKPLYSQISDKDMRDIIRLQIGQGTLFAGHAADHR